jgi:D-alanyl-lipoteichoic acid acyltransferase DltB (MBOAT superfamily)
MIELASILLLVALISIVFIGLSIYKIYCIFQTAQAFASKEYTLAEEYFQPVWKITLLFLILGVFRITVLDTDTFKNTIHKVKEENWNQ